LVKFHTNKHNFKLSTNIYVGIGILHLIRLGLTQQKNRKFVALNF
jgi:hypothetical protein